MFIAALFTIAKTWKKPKCLSTDECTKKMCYVCIYICVYIYIYTHIYIMEYYSAIKMNEIMPFAATWMNLEIIILSEVSQKERQIPYDITYMWNMKYDINELIYETETDLQT